MRRIRTLLLLIPILALPAAAPAQQHKSQSEVSLGSGKIDLPQGETTTMRGKPPIDLNGYWLVSENHQLPEGKIFPALQLYLISADAKGKLVVNWFDFQPPAAIADKLRKAQQTHQAWEPDKDDIAAIQAAVAANPPAVSPKRRGRHVVSVAKEFDAPVKKAPEAKGALLAIQSLFQPAGKPAYGQSYYATKVSKDELSGTFTMGAVPMNSLGVPLPIGTKGPFHWIHLAVATPAKGAEATQEGEAKPTSKVTAPQGVKPH